MDKQREDFEKWYEQQPLAWRDEISMSEADFIWQAALASRDAEPVENPDKLRPAGTEDMAIYQAISKNYTAPPNLSAAVAAAIEQAAQVAVRDEYNKYTAQRLAKAIRALQTDDGLAALRQMLTRMHVLTVKHFEDTSISVNDLIERVMKGE